MIISHSHKFIFIHVYKVAGTSISTSLRDYSYIPSKKNKLKSFLNIYPTMFNNDFNQHIKAKELKSVIPIKLFYSYFKFGFVRNPWDWQVSLYHFALQTPDHHQYELIKSMHSFDEYIDWRINKDCNLQKDFFYDEDVLLVDYVGRLESLEVDFAKICKKMEVPSINLPNKNQSKHKNYRQYYNDQTKKYVEEAFAEDIKTFDYQF